MAHAGKWTPNDPAHDPGAGWYVDARGVEWKVTVESVGDGLVKKAQYTAQSSADADAGRYFVETGWTVRTFDALLDDIDAYAASKRSGGGLGALVVVLAALWLLDKRGR